jgi:hypothetical protein
LIQPKMRQNSTLTRFSRISLNAPAEDEPLPTLA